MLAKFEYLKQIKLGNSGSDGFIIKPVNMALGYTDDFPDLNTPFQTIKAEISFPRVINDYTYEDYLLDLEKMLKSNGHLFSERIAMIITFIFLLIREKSLSTADGWRKLSNSFFTKCNLHMEFPTQLLYDENEPTLDLGSYQIGCFDFDAFEAKIKSNTISDFSLRYKKSASFHADKKYLSFKRIENKINVINLLKLVKDKYLDASHHQAVFGVYFEALSWTWFEKFWLDLDEQQSTSVALGGVHYDLTFFRDFNFGKGVQVCVFTHLGGDPKQGWVIPIDRRITSVHYDSKSPIDVLNKKVQSYYEALNSGDSPFVRLIDVLTTFLSNGNRLLFQNKVNEAFLNFWIGLDSILNPTDMAKSKELTKKVAALTYPGKSSSYELHHERIKLLYRYRGSLVHAGRNIERSDALELADLLEEILMHLLEMHKKAVNDKGFDLNAWFQAIDELAHLLVNKAKPEKLKPLLKKLVL